MLTQAELDSFHQNGYLIMRGLFQNPELEMLQKAVDVVQAQGVAREGAEHRYIRNHAGEEVYWRSEKMWQRADIFQIVTVHPTLLENIGQCIGRPFFPINDSLVVKLTDNGAPVTWHQDPPYMNENRDWTFPIPNFTTDIYLDHSGPDNGCVYAIPGHHLIGSVDLTGKGEEELFEKFGAIPIEMEAGDVMFHCLSTPHGSRANTSSRQRRIFYIHYMSHEVYTDAYSGWGRWDEGIYSRARQMIDKRVAMGYETPDDRSMIQLDQTGFQFSGTPCTPEGHWGNLQKTIDPTDALAMKKLEL
ncbi:phytanoyl-CoA dioxygenase family protein [Alicyclobacillus fodiniaquatilis]|uniref:Phytanoyl-CoA dioxygenase family protein n=1 Tax=Alicyclobacillus fodiniaquatilis TaxID=1661150 RepID=A0ABW4JF74_9BACL